MVDQMLSAQRGVAVLDARFAMRQSQIATAVNRAILEWKSNESRLTEPRAITTGEQVESLEKQFLRLALLSPVEYDRCREAEAKSLEIRSVTLDAEVKKRRQQNPDSGKQGSAILFPEDPPWPSKIENLAKLLDEIEGYIKRHIAISDESVVAITLWAAHTHIFRAFDYTPRLNLNAPEMGCGKTTTLDVLQTLTPKALRTENISTAVLFRLIERESPTLLIDEYDTTIKDNDELRGALNAGHKRGGVILRCEGDNNEPMAYKTFAPVALAGIGTLPGTLLDRSIVIQLQRAMPGEVKEQLNLRKPNSDLRRKMARWAADNNSEIEDMEPQMPDGFLNRRADKWRPLFAIAQLAGGRWPNAIADAADKLSGNEDGGESTRTQLLAALNKLFEKSPSDRLATGDIIEALIADDEAPWKTYRKGNPIDARGLAKLLRPLGAKSATRRDGAETFKGYDLKDFAEAFARYLPASGGNYPSQRHNQASMRVCGEFASVTDKNVVTDKKSSKPDPVLGCDGVTDKNPHPDGEQG